MEQKAYISELFYSIQGEGQYVGTPSVFLRFFGCNLNCKGFGQKCPMLPETYEEEHIDGSIYKSIEEVKVPKFGCDTPYARDKSYLHLSKCWTVKETAQEIINLLSEKVDTTDCRFKCNNGSNIHLVITGGEPMLQQEYIASLIKELDVSELHYITIETNGTIRIEDCLLEATRDKELFMSISPKLFCCSGIPTDTAIKLDVLNEYMSKVERGQLKFVASTNDEVWNEIRDIVKNLEQRKYPIVIMPVGSTLEQLQQNSTTIAERCLKCGYKFSPRLHVNLWGNKSGT